MEVQSMSKKFRIIIVLTLWCILYCNGCKKDNNENKVNHEIPKEITVFVTNVLQAIKNEDMEYIIDVLYDGEVEYDYYKFKPKEEVVKDLRNKEKIYYELFDTEGLFEYMSKYEHRGKDNKPSPVSQLKMLYPEIHSVKEKIENRKNIRIERVEVLDKEKNVIRCHLIDDYEIEMKKESPLSENIFLKKVDIIIINGKIYLYSLFFDDGVLAI